MSRARAEAPPPLRKIVRLPVSGLRLVARDGWLYPGDFRCSGAKAIALSRREQKEAI